MGVDEITVLFRGMERLIIVGAAVLALYLGYKLFLSGFDSEQSGELSGENFTFKLIKVGPGVFFALFGTFVLVAMAWANIELNGPGNQRMVDAAGSQDRLTSFFGAEESAQIQRELEMDSIMKERFRTGDVSKEVFVNSVGGLQKTLARLYVGKEIYEKCEFDAESSNTQTVGSIWT